MISYLAQILIDPFTLFGIASDSRMLFLIVIFANRIRKKQLLMKTMNAY